MQPRKVCIAVAYAEVHRAIVKHYELIAPATVDDALRRAGEDPDFTGISLDDAVVGIFGKVTGRLHVLNDGDRVEIYRPLADDPKTARRARAKQARRRRQ